MRYFIAVVVLLAAFGAADAQVIYNSASTAAEGYYRGLGGAIAAQGEKNLSDSQAAINLTDARSSQIDNQVKSVNAYWQKKDIYNQQQQKKFYEIEQRRATHLKLHGIQPLTPQQFDRTTGQITWPGPFKAAEFDSYRTQVDNTFKKRAEGGILTGDDYMKTTAAIKDWRGALTEQKADYPSAILSQMLRFLLALNRDLNDNLG